MTITVQILFKPRPLKYCPVCLKDAKCSVCFKCSCEKSKCTLHKCCNSCTKERCKSQCNLRKWPNKACERCFFCKSVSFCPSCDQCPQCCRRSACGARLQKFWQVWAQKGSSPRVVSILKEGYNLSFGLKPPLTRLPLIRSGYANPLRNSYLQEALHSLLQKQAIERVWVQSSGVLQQAFHCPQTK